MLNAPWMALKRKMADLLSLQSTMPCCYRNKSASSYAHPLSSSLVLFFLCLCIQIHNMYYNTQDFFIWQNPTRFIAKPLLLTILLTSQAIELESTSKNVSFNASTYIVPFRLHGGIPLSSSLVSNSIF